MSGIIGSIAGWFGGVSGASSASNSSAVSGMMRSASPAAAPATSAAATPKKQASKAGMTVLTTRDVMVWTGQYLYVKEIIALFSVNKKLYAQYLGKNVPLPQFWGPIARRFSNYPKREALHPEDLKLLKGILKEDEAALQAFQKKQSDLAQYGISSALIAFMEPRSWIREHFAKKFSEVSPKTVQLLGGKENLILAPTVFANIGDISEKLQLFVDSAGLDGLQTVQKDPFVEEARQKLLSSPVLYVGRLGCHDHRVIDLVIRVERTRRGERKEILIYLSAQNDKVTSIFANFLSRPKGPSFEKGLNQYHPKCPTDVSTLHGRRIPGRSFPEDRCGPHRQSLNSWVEELIKGKEVFFFPHADSEPWIKDIQTTDVTFRLAGSKSAGTATAATAVSSAASK